MNKLLLFLCRIKPANEIILLSLNWSVKESP